MAMQLKLGDNYKPIDVHFVSPDMLNTQAKEHGVYNENEQIEGLWVPNNHCIYVSNNPKVNTAEFIFMHELIHCIDDLTDMHEEENRVDAKANLLLAFIRENNLVLRKIISKELHK